MPKANESTLTLKSSKSKLSLVGTWNVLEGHPSNSLAESWIFGPDTRKRPFHQHGLPCPSKSWNHTVCTEIDPCETVMVIFLSQAPWYVGYGTIGMVMHGVNCSGLKLHVLILLMIHETGHWFRRFQSEGFEEARAHILSKHGSRGKEVDNLWIICPDCSPWNLQPLP